MIDYVVVNKKLGWVWILSNIRVLSYTWILPSLSFIFSNGFILVRVAENPGTVLEALGVKWEYTLEGMQVHQRALLVYTFTHYFTPKIN